MIKLKKLKDNKGSISVVVIVTILFFVTILVSMYTVNAVRRESQLKTEMRIKNEYEDEFSKTDDIYSNLSISVVDAYKNGYLQQGDYVNYSTPTTGSYTSLSADNGYADQTFDVSNDSTQVNWRVLGLTEDGKNLMLISGMAVKKNYDTSVTITDTNSPYYYLQNAEGYIHGIDELNNICSIYKNNLADNVRSINIQDINRLCGVTVGTTTVINSSGDNINECADMGTSYTYTNKYKTPNDYLTNTRTPSFSYTMMEYSYLGSDAISSSTALYDILFKDTIKKDTIKSGWYWLASQFIGATSYNADFTIGEVFNAYVGFSQDSLFFSDGDEYYNCDAVRPVAILKSGVTLKDLKKISTPTEASWPQ